MRSELVVAVVVLPVVYLRVFLLMRSVYFPCGCREVVCDGYSV